METSTVYFDEPGAKNTDATLEIARKRSKELGIKKVVVASNSGDTAVKAVGVFTGYRVIAVSHVTGFAEPNAQEFSDKNREIVEGAGGVVLTTAHAFGGVSRALRRKLDTVSIGDIIANALRIFGQGTKVCCEMALMTADAGLTHTDEEIILIAGSAKGADTAVVLNPINSSRFFDIKVKEIVCKPRF